MTNFRLTPNNFKSLYSRYEKSIEDRLKTVDVDYAEKVYIDLCKNNRNFKKMLDACKKKEMKVSEILDIVLFHSLVLSSNNIYEV